MHPSPWLKCVMLGRAHGGIPQHLSLPFIVPCFLPVPFRLRTSEEMNSTVMKWYNMGVSCTIKSLPLFWMVPLPPFLRTSPLHCAEDDVVNLQPLNIYHCPCCPQTRPLLFLSLCFSLSARSICYLPLFVLHPDHPSFFPTPFYHTPH